jgi:hypothetical protein
MAQRVLLLLTQRHSTPPFIAFGAGHFFGVDSVLQLIAAAGYRLTAVSSSAVGGSTRSQQRNVFIDRRAHGAAALQQTPVINDLWVRDDVDWLTVRRRQRTLPQQQHQQQQQHAKNMFSQWTTQSVAAPTLSTRHEPLFLHDDAKDRIYHYVMYNTGTAQGPCRPVLTVLSLITVVYRCFICFQMTS